MSAPAPVTNRGRALVFVLITVLLDTIGFGIIAPVTPELIMELTGEGLSAAAVYGGWLLFAYASMQFVLAPIMGQAAPLYFPGASFFAAGVLTLLAGGLVARTLRTRPSPAA